EPPTNVVFGSMVSASATPVASVLPALLMAMVYLMVSPGSTRPLPLTSVASAHVLVAPMLTAGTVRSSRRSSSNTVRRQLEGRRFALRAVMALQAASFRNQVTTMVHLLRKKE